MKHGQILRIVQLNIKVLEENVDLEVDKFEQTLIINQNYKLFQSGTLAPGGKANFVMTMITMLKLMTLKMMVIMTLKMMTMTMITSITLGEKLVQRKSLIGITESGSERNESLTKN